MSDQNKKNIQIDQDAPKSDEGAHAAQAFSWKRLLTKKWVFPATYMAAAAIILTLLWVYQDSGTNQVAKQTTGKAGVTQSGTDSAQKPDSVSVAAPTETFAWPVKNHSEEQVSLSFYDSKASNEVKQAAMVEYENTFTPHLGIDLAQQNNQPFDVVAALSGTVTQVEKNPLVGNLVEITSANGIVTVYQSLADIAVAKGTTVKQGDLIAQAGRNELEKDEGVHLHFEVRQSGAAVNPMQFLGQ
jgi:stage II sporulation protein Q